MSRYRPPQPQPSPYITKQGFEKLQQEDIDLCQRRARVTRALSAAAAEGDRSENAEYIYRKKQLAGIDRRIRYLQKRLPDLNIVTDVGNEDQIFFGAWVRLENEEGKEVEYRIVGPDEIESDSARGYISVDSPLATAMLKKQVDDEIVLRLGDRAHRYCINRIRYR